MPDVIPAATVAEPGSKVAMVSTIVIAAVAAYLLRELLKSGSSRNPPRRLSLSDIDQWVDNDEGLYDWWRGSRMSKRAFIRENRAELESAIQKVLGGEKRAHWLKYGNPRRRSRKRKSR